VRNKTVTKERFIELCNAVASRQELYGVLRADLGFTSYPTLNKADLYGYAIWQMVAEHGQPPFANEVYPLMKDLA
jgi:DNA-binding PadR family transcriptional regulator